MPNETDYEVQQDYHTEMLASIQDIGKFNNRHPVLVMIYIYHCFNGKISSNLAIKVQENKKTMLTFLDLLQ